MISVGEITVAETKVPDAELDHLVTRVTENAKSVDTLLKSFAALVGMIVLLKLLGNHDFSWNGMTFSVANDAILICSLLSVAHFFTAYRVVRSAHVLWKANDVEHGKAAFANVTETGSIFVRELVPRVDYRKGFLLSIYKMDWSDPSAWAAYGFAILLPCAIVPYDLSNLLRFFMFFAGAICITIFNWVVASAWIIALSELTQQSDAATYHLQLEAKQRKRHNNLKNLQYLTGLVIPIGIFIAYLLMVGLIPLFIAGAGFLLITRTASFLAHFHGFLAILGIIAYIIGILFICLSIILFFFIILVFFGTEGSGP